MRLTTWLVAFAGLVVLSVGAIAVGHSSPEQRALESTAAIVCPDCGKHTVATAVYLGDGTFLTAYHCAPDEGAIIPLRIDDLPYIATVSRASAPHHLSTLQVVASDIPLRPARVAVEPGLVLGTRVFAVGHPAAVPFVAFHGQVAKPSWARGDQGQDDWPAKVLVLDGPSAPGMSGGGVFLQRNGRLVGISIASNAQGNIVIAVGLDDVQDFIASAG